MKTLSEFKPSTYDSTGVGPNDRQDWSVAPVNRNRDTEDCIEVSNWRSFINAMPNEEDYEIHKFNHWACGWFEIILIRPGSECETVAAEIEKRLQDYAIIDESDWSEVEQESAQEQWESWQRSEVKQDLAKLIADRKALDADDVEEALSDDAIDEWFSNHQSEGSSDYYSPDGAHCGYYWDIDNATENEVQSILKWWEHEQSLMISVGDIVVLPSDDGEAVAEEVDSHRIYVRFEGDTFQTAYPRDQVKRKDV